MEQSKMTQVFGVSPEEFKESILSDVRTELKSLAQNFQPITPQEYLTRQETAEILKVSLVTLSDWNKKKILNYSEFLHSLDDFLQVFISESFHIFLSAPLLFHVDPNY